MFEFHKRTKENNSKDIAKERLQNILIKERTKVDGNSLIEVKKDFVSSAKEYFNIDEKRSDVKLTRMKIGKEKHEENVLVSIFVLKD